MNRTKFYFTLFATVSLIFGCGGSDSKKSFREDFKDDNKKISLEKKRDDLKNACITNGQYNFYMKGDGFHCDFKENTEIYVVNSEFFETCRKFNLNHVTTPNGMLCEAILLVPPEKDNKKINIDKLKKDLQNKCNNKLQYLGIGSFFHQINCTSPINIQEYKNTCNSYGFTFAFGYKEDGYFCKGFYKS